MGILTEPRRYDWEWELDAPPESLWPLVADTDRFNRDTGLPPVVDMRSADEPLPPGRRRLQIRVAGVPVEWEESPFEWVAPTRFGVVRRYRRGPLREMRVQVELEPLGADRTRLAYRVQAWPRGPLGLLAIPVQIGWISRRSFGRTFQRYAEEVGRRRREEAAKPAEAPPVAAAGGSILGEVGALRLRALGDRLVELGHAGALVELLNAHIERGDEADLTRMRPYALADGWGADRRATLRLLLAGAREGLVDLRWDVICPLCRGTKAEVDALDRLPEGEVHCETCMVDFEADLERSVELTFLPAAGIRAVRVGAFCVAGPRTTPHVLVQQLLPTGDRREMAPSLACARYRVRTFDGKRAAPFEVAEGGAERLAVELGPAGALRVEPGVIAPGARVTIDNRTGEEQVVLVDATGWGADAATAAEVLVLQEFRDLFSREVLAAGRSAGVGTLTIVFTDLKGSTALYRSLGDGPAFDRVADHFRLLKEAIEPERGSVVKTIGDAVMAAFLEPAGALRAVLRAHAALAADERCASLVLKAALHTGPCIAVTLNERLDYFGSTVNVAARLAGLSHGSDIVMSEAVRGDPGVGALLSERGLTVEGFRAPLRGIQDDVMLWRARAPRPGAERA